MAGGLVAQPDKVVIELSANWQACSDRVSHTLIRLECGHVDGNPLDCRGLVKPGQTAEPTWTLSKAARLEFACNILGH